MSDQSQYPPVLKVAIMSELMTLAAIFVEHKEKAPATLVIKRIKMLLEGKEMAIFGPEQFQTRLNTLLHAVSKLR